MSNDSPTTLDRSVKPLYFCLVAWASVVLLYNAYHREISTALWIMEVVPLLALFCIGLGFVLWAIFALFKSRFRSRPVLVTLAGIAAASAGVYFAVPAAVRWQFFVFPVYKRHIANMKRLPGHGQNSYCRANGCSIDRSVDDNVLRVSFVEPGGILDNYTAIVYDPSGLVMRANEFKGDWSNFSDPRLAKVKRLFGGDLFWAKSLGASFYRCGFT